MLSRKTVEALFRSVLQTGKEESVQIAVDHIMDSLSEPHKQGETPRTEQEASLLAAIDGNYAGMSHADLVHTAKMLHKGRQLWRERAETAERRVSELEAERQAWSDLHDAEKHRADRLDAKLAEDGRDAELLDWLERRDVEVRTPAVHGSFLAFKAFTVDGPEGGEDLPSDLRAKVRAALAAERKESGNG